MLPPPVLWLLVSAGTASAVAAGLWLRSMLSAHSYQPVGAGDVDSGDADLELGRGRRWQPSPQAYDGDAAAARKAPHSAAAMSESARQATVLAATWCRNSVGFSWLDEPLAAMGRRRGKHSFLVSRADSGHRTDGQLLLTLSALPEQCSLALERDVVRKQFFSLLRAAKHSGLLPIVHAEYLRERRVLLTVRPFKPRGSLKDVIYSADPKAPYADKYGRDGQPLPEETIALYGRQILQATLALRAAGIVHNHLHSGNVLVDVHVVCLTDWENTLLSQPPPAAIAELTLPRERSVSEPVLQFGHLLYEMAMGYEMETPYPDFLGGSCPPAVAALLKRIFTPKSRVTLEELLRSRFFASAKHARRSRARLRLPAEAKEAIIAPAMKMNAALQSARLAKLPRRRAARAAAASAAPRKRISKRISKLSRRRHRHLLSSSALPSSSSSKEEEQQEEDAEQQEEKEEEEEEGSEEEEESEEEGSEEEECSEEEEEEEEDGSEEEEEEEQGGKSASRRKRRKKQQKAATHGRRAHSLFEDIRSYDRQTLRAAPAEHA
eukprot:PLAT11600.1.p1 GENE.PLAT11600.1~~PLAT11600.1.p1  ORF type:complete len:550 (+),score=280.48 PLAT11600.1:54-1703(+)